MAITPADIQAQTFSEAKRGYDPAEVDVFRFEVEVADSLRMSEFDRVADPDEPFRKC